MMKSSGGNLPLGRDYPATNSEPRAQSDRARNSIHYSIEALKSHFQNRQDVYVSGQLFVYYAQGNPNALVVPDVFVVFGVPPRDRLCYKLWEENNCAPDFVLEITSQMTVGKDSGVKRGIYALLGIREYFQYDPLDDSLRPRLKGMRLIQGDYQPIQPISLPEGSLSLTSEVLGLELRLVRGGELRFYNPKSGAKLLSYRECNRARRHAISRLFKLGLTAEQIAEALEFSLEEVQRSRSS